MIKTQNYRFLICLALFALAACSGAKKEEAADEGVATVLPDEKNEVTVLPLKRQIFNHELVSNGKIVAGGMADLRFESSGIVAQIYVKNGDRVHKGQKLAELDKFRLKNKTAQSKDALEKAKLELQDVLIGQGYAADDTANVPDDIMQLARVKSALFLALGLFLRHLNSFQKLLKNYLLLFFQFQLLYLDALLNIF